MSDKIVHKKIAAACFNATWDLIDKKGALTTDEVDTMLHTCHASFYHWTQEPEHTPQNISVGYWQLARVYALAKIEKRALYYAEKCVSVSLQAQLPPFFIAYGYEALCRAAVLSGDRDKADSAMKNARDYCDKITVAENKKILQADLDELSVM